MIYKKALLSLGIGLLFILGWSPWFSKDEVRAVVKANKNFQYQHTTEKNTAGPEIHVTWFPFCRWATTYEGGWFVCFWHGFKKDSAPAIQSSATMDKSVDGKIYVDNEFREKEIARDTYLKSLAPMIIYPDKGTGEFVGMDTEGKQKILDIPKVNFYHVSSIVLDKNSDAVYYKDSKYDTVLKKQMGTINKIDITRKTSSTLISSISGEVEYADQNGLLINDENELFQVYNSNTGLPIQPQSLVHLADSGEYKTEYRIVKNDKVYQIVFDNKGGLVLKGKYRGFQAGSEAMKIHFNEIGTLNREYITKNNITPYTYLRAVYDDQENTKLFYTKTTGDIWPTSNHTPKLVLYPTHPVFTNGYYFTYYTMGNLYDVGNGRYAQVIGDGLVLFDSSDMSVVFTKDKEEIKSVLLNKPVIAVPNYIEEAKTPAGCQAVIDPVMPPYQGIAGHDKGIIAQMSSSLSQAMSKKGYSWPIYCLR